MKWSLRGYSYTTQPGTVENFFDDDLTPDRLADPKQRISGDLKYKSGKPISPQVEAQARILTQTQEPHRVLVSVQDESTGRTQFAWIYLEDYGDKWSEVKWDEVLQDFTKQYNIEVTKPKPEPIQAPIEPKPEPVVDTRPPLKPKKKKNIWDRIQDDIREIFLAPPGAVPQPKPKKKKSVWDKLPARIRRIFKR